MQAIAATTHIAEQRVEALLDVAEHLVSVIFRTGTRLALELAGVSQDGVGLLLGDANNLLLGGDGHCLAAGILDHAVRFGFRIVEKALALAYDLTRLREFARERVADLVDDLERGGHIYLAKIVLAENWLCFLKQNREFLKKTQNPGFVHVIPSNLLHMRRFIDVWRAKSLARMRPIIISRRPDLAKRTTEHS